MLVSIIIPTYNAENFIVDTLTQLTSVTENYQIVIVDDGSSDQTVSFIQEYCRSNPTEPVKLIQQKNQGVSVARNTGIKEADGEFLVFCDADDKLCIDFIQIVSQYQDMADVILWRYSVLHNGTEIIPQKMVNQEVLTGQQAFTQYLYKECYVRMGSFAVKKELLEKKDIFFTPDCRFAEDLEFIFKMLYCSTKIQYDSKVYYQYIKRNGSSIYSYNIRRFDAPLAIDRVINFIKTDKHNLEIKEELDFLSGEFYLKHYFYSLDSCLQHLKLWDYYSFIISYTNAYRELDQNVQKKVRKVTFKKIDYSGKRIRLMKISIRVYVVTMLLNHTIKSRRTTMKSQP